MKLIADAKGRLTSADLFPPFKPFSAERQPDGSIRLVELVEKEVPILKPRKVRGKFSWPEGFKPSRERIAAAIRADRDSQ
jgi:hypothetical protein